MTQQSGVALGYERTSCRMCGSGSLERYLDLGHVPLADSFPTSDDLKAPVTVFPLSVNSCRACGHSQLSYVVPPTILYPSTYPYETSTTASGRTHFDAFASDSIRRFDLGRGDLVVDIGSNDGTLLSSFRDRGMRVLGVDPAADVAATAIQRGIPTIVSVFDAQAVSEATTQHGKAALVLGANVFAHIDDLDEFIVAVDTLLRPGGVIVLEFPMLDRLVSGMEYDTVYHEHLSYMSLTAVVPFFEARGFRVFDALESVIHGGSVRIFVDRLQHRVSEDAIDRILRREESVGTNNFPALLAFGQRVREHALALRKEIHGLRSMHRLAIASTPAKGMTLLSVAGLGRQDFEYATEKNPRKIGRFTSAGHIPIVADSMLDTDTPDIILILAWNFAEEVVRNLAHLRQSGARFISPVPQPHFL